MLPAVTALMGATVLMVWIRPNIEEMIDAVDWTTLVFFMTLFIVVGGIQEVGLISFIADGIGRLVGENLTLAILGGDLVERAALDDYCQYPLHSCDAARHRLSDGDNSRGRK